MARRFATDVDILGFSLLNAMLHPVSADPGGLGTSDKGRVWFNSTDNKLKVWNGTTAIDFTDLANSTGNLTASRISDFDTQVRTNRLDQMADPTASVSLNNQRITALADGVAGTDAASYGQVLALINNRSFKDPVLAATQVNITSLEGGAPNEVDGVTLSANDRVLVKSQSTGELNGIYTVDTVGTGANGTWTRATDADSTGELPPGAVLSVEEGDESGDKLFMLATNGPITVGTTPLVFSPYGASSGEIGVAGAGLTKTGSTYDVGAGSTGTITVGADSVDVDVSRVPRKWVGAIPDSSGTVDGLSITVAGAQVTFNHGSNNRVASVVVRAGTTPASGFTTGEVVEMTDVTVDSSNVRITLPAAPSADNWEFMVVA